MKACCSLSCGAQAATGFQGSSMLSGGNGGNLQARRSGALSEQPDGSRSSETPRRGFFGRQEPAAATGDPSTLPWGAQLVPRYACLAFKNVCHASPPISLTHRPTHSLKSCCNHCEDAAAGGRRRRRLSGGTYTGAPPPVDVATMTAMVSANAGPLRTANGHTPAAPRSNGTSGAIRCARAPSSGARWP